MICKVIRARYPDQPSWELSKGGLFGTSCLSGQFYFPVLHPSICRCLKKCLYVHNTSWEGDSVNLRQCRKFWPGGRGWALSSQLPTIYPHLLCRRCLLKQTWTLLVLQGWHEAQNYNTLKKERGKAHFLSTTWQSGNCQKRELCICNFYCGKIEWCAIGFQIPNYRLSHCIWQRVGLYWLGSAILLHYSGLGCFALRARVWQTAGFN